MESKRFIEQLKALVASENPLAVSNEIIDLKSKFNDFMLKEGGTAVSEYFSTEDDMEDELEIDSEDSIVEPDEELQVEVTLEVVGDSVEEKTAEDATVEPIEETKAKIATEVVEINQEAEIALEIVDSESIESIKDEFYSIFKEYQARKKEVINARNASELVNLQEKKTLIKKLQDVVTKEENIGSAFASFKEIQDSWKIVGDIPRANRSEIQAEYSKLLEDFFYNIKIYKELKDHDFHRNYQLKMEIIDRLKALISVKNIKEIEVQLKAIQNDWEDIGPVPNDKWDEVKDAYWTEVRSSYERINRFYDDRRIEQQVNLKKKEDLLALVKEIAAEAPTLESTKDWDNKTMAILEAQKTWKTIGFGPKKENEQIWKTFRTACDEFFDAKKTFFGKVNEQFDGVAAQKQALIDKANVLQGSTDWKETANQIIQLQKQWKTLGHAGRKNEQNLWKAFRTACDIFFDARNAHFGEQDKAFDDNLKAKQDLIKEIEGTKLPADKKEALTLLKELSSKFNAIGHVPMKAKDAIFKSFKSAMDVQYGALKMDGEEKESILFDARIDTIRSSPDAANLFYGMKQDLRKEIDKLQKEIALLENNLGFFANSKGADALKKDVEVKVNRAKEKIDYMKRKLKMIPNE